MAQTKAPTLAFTHDDACELGTDLERTDATRGHACGCAVREIGWVAHEANALTATLGSMGDAPKDTERWKAYTARKRALLAFVESTR